MNWSVVTITHNSERALGKAWKTWEPQDDIEWVVVDNASHDNSIQTAHRLGASSVVPLDRNLGFGAANNLGVALSTGRSILFANPDLTVKKEDLVTLDAYLDHFGGIVAPQLINPDGTPQPNGRGFPTLSSKIRNRAGKRPDPKYQILVQAGEAQRVCFVMGAALAIRRSTLEDLGGWDAKYFVYYEDSDICIREWCRGGEVRVLGEIQWTHQWARETASFRVLPWVYELRSMVTFYTRYPALLGSRKNAGRHFPMIKLENTRTGESMQSPDVIKDYSC